VKLGNTAESFSRTYPRYHHDLEYTIDAGSAAERITWDRVYNLCGYPVIRIAALRGAAVVALTYPDVVWHYWNEPPFLPAWSQGGVTVIQNSSGVFVRNEWDRQILPYTTRTPRSQPFHWRPAIADTANVKIPESLISRALQANPALDTPNRMAAWLDAQS
jgi:hypothetical protein